MYEISEGWINGARQVHSPNFNERPDVKAIDAIIIHSISLPPGNYGGSEIDEFFCNQLNWEKHPYFNEIRGLEVSSHLLIRRTGELVQYVSLLSRAWHAGQSCLAGQENCNDFSIGIELEGTDSDSFEAAQYQTLVDVTRALMKQFPAISKARIAGHSDIAPGRKTDPGSGFDWQFYKQRL
jgi:AmpD protein